MIYRCSLSIAMIDEIIKADLFDNGYSKFQFDA